MTSAMAAFGVAVGAIAEEEAATEAAATDAARICGKNGAV